MVGNSSEDDTNKIDIQLCDNNFLFTFMHTPISVELFFIHSTISQSIANYFSLFDSSLLYNFQW